MKSKKLIGLVTAFCAAIAGCQAQPVLKSAPDNNSLLWEISGNGLSKPSYLFGTFHLMCKDDIHFSEPLKQALSNATELYLELDMDDPSSTLGAIFFMNMKNDKTLADVMSARDYKTLETFFKDSLHSSLAMMQHMKPFFLEALLYPKMMPCKNISGVEEGLMEIAKAEKKEIKGLETVAFQASVFDSIPYEDQAKELIKTIDSLAENKTKFRQMDKMYRDQRLDSLASLMNEEESGIAANRELLLDKRNRNWVGQLGSIMLKNNVFVAVGAGHLVGESGVIALLQKKGYKVRPLLNK